jgi:uncharacterized DUF497 family protein
VFTWDEAKGRANLRKHDIDFVDAPKIFQRITFTADESWKASRIGRAYGAPRFRIISIRKATTHEARYYFSQITN